MFFLAVFGMGLVEQQFFPIMIVCMLVVIIFQVRSLPALAMTVLTAPLGLVGVVPILLLFLQPFGFDAILGLTGVGHSMKRANPL